MRQLEQHEGPNFRVACLEYNRGSRGLRGCPDRSIWVGWSHDRGTGCDSAHRRESLHSSAGRSYRCPSSGPSPVAIPGTAPVTCAVTAKKPPWRGTTGQTAMVNVRTPPDAAAFWKRPVPPVISKTLIQMAG